LKQFLLALGKDDIQDDGCSAGPNTRLPPLTHTQKLSMCLQVALAMEHLTNNRFIHRDLAARNILLTSSLDVKVACLSICRDIYADEYYLTRDQTLIPLRWMAPEAALKEEFTAMTDVWAFGVFAWEVFSFAELPYRTRTNEEVLRDLQVGDCRIDFPSGETGTSISQTTVGPSVVLTLIQSCLAPCAGDRPSFREIVEAICDNTNNSGHYL